MPKSFNPKRKKYSLPSNVKGASYAGALTPHTPERLKELLEKYTNALNKWKKIIGEEIAAGRKIPNYWRNHAQQLMHEISSTTKDLHLATLPPTERKTYLLVMDRYIESQKRLADQIQSATDSQLLDLLNRHSRRLATKIQNLSTKYQPMGIPELGDLPERPAAGPVDIDRPPPSTGSQRSSVRRMRGGVSRLKEDQRSRQIAKHLAEQWQKYKKSSKHN